MQCEDARKGTKAIRMMPGMNMNPKQMEKIMSQMGIKSTSVEAVRVIIEREGDRIVLEPAEVMAIEMQGKKTYQISGTERVEQVLNEDDVKLVAQQAGVSEAAAREALAKAKGDIAQAILELKK
ncbi:MAG: nascent polypeptide-associated complex protein [Candidatus Burarchaeum sp.]|nr:nascent polypeptide-associated complex protein [Candidatus Burarchaeum sp.]MDO8340066.1 nascent polypeptide-associated complex protein [Candidatus Burarchaeum sp.]